MRTRSSIVFGLWIWLSGQAAWAFPVIEWNTVSGSFSASDFTINTSSLLGYDIRFWGSISYGGNKSTLVTEDMLASLYQKWVPMSYGDLIYDASIAEGIPLADNANYYDWYPLVLDMNVPCYLGFQIGENDGSPEFAEYGWVELFYDGTTISVGSSATERTGLGIYAGTGSAIPEPTTAGMLLIGAMGLAWKRRMQKHELRR